MEGVIQRLDVVGKPWQAYAEVFIPYVIGFSGAILFDTREEAEAALPSVRRGAARALEQWMEDNYPYG